jgi:predicted SnoaL-like aldol condensation-catalyzing enzyme
MSVSDVNKQKVRQFIEEVLNEGRLELIDELVAKDFIGRLGCAVVALNGPDGVRRFVSGRRMACPDLYMKIEDQIAEDDRVVTRWRTTTRGPAAPVSTASIGPCGHCAGITIIRLLAGKQVDAHTQCTGPRVVTGEGAVSSCAVRAILDLRR